MSRDAIQAQVEQLFDTNDRIILSWATGVGKSYMSIQLQKKMGNPKTFICVAEITHIENWKDEYRKHGCEYLLANTSIFCYHSLSKYENTSIDLLILDEVHHLTDLRQSSLATIPYKKLIGLSATINFDEFVNFKEVFGKFALHKVSLAKAVEMDILTSPTIYLLPLELDNTQQTEVFEITYGKPRETIEVDYNIYKSYSKKTNILLRVRCTPAEKYLYLSNIVDYHRQMFMRSYQEFLKNKWLLASTQRKQFLASMKTKTLQQIIEYIGDKKFICFCGSIAQAEYLSPNYLHSKLKSSEQKRVLKAFNADEIRSLFVVNKLKEGQNLEGIESGIICQLDNQTRSFIQRLGRVLRNKVNPEIFVLYYKNTQDATYLQTAFADIPKESIKSIVL